jgi:hypothetical protein
MAAEFVEKLIVAGHALSVATFTHGGKETLLSDGPKQGLPKA